jgi:TPP-dependent pyruvate/acetoin dehydrogenase alpha subunit
LKNYYETFAFNPSRGSDLYRMMAFIRTFEEKLLEQFGQGKIFGTTHTCIGQEANAVSIITSLERDRDTIWSNHRCHGHFLAYCGNAYGLFAEILGKKDGVCGGRGGSQHLAYRNFFSSGIQGGLASIGVGTALGDKRNGAISTVFLGDGTMGEGSVYEALNMASLWNAPVLFVIEDNGIAQTTDKHLGVAGEISKRAEPFGIRSASLKSTYVHELIKASRDAIEYVRVESKPFWLHIETTRLMAHSKSDDTRDPSYVADLWAEDCLPKVAPSMAERTAIDAEIASYIDEAFALAEAGENI